MILGKHKQYIVEWGSVSSSVVKASNILSKAIWKDSFKKRVNYSWDENKPYIEGEFDFSFDDVGLDVGSIYKITYTFYMVDNIAQYNRLFSNVNGDESANSSSDFINKRINIVSGIIGWSPSPDFLSNVMHEVDHIFEYSKGFKKNETLYNEILYGLNSDDEAKKTVARLMYFGFKSEQDAFVHQFYGSLVQNKYEGDFDTALHKISEYGNLLNAYVDFVHGRVPRNEIIKACNELGTSFEHVIRFSHYIKNKMMNKLFKAYNRYMINSAKGVTMESIHQKNGAKRMLFAEYQERYKNMEIKKEKYIEEL